MVFANGLIDFVGKQVKNVHACLFHFLPDGVKVANLYVMLFTNLSRTLEVRLKIALFLMPASK